MIIEIGKEYAVSPRYKKSFEENEYWTDGKGKRITITTLWRGGTINITPQNQDEAAWLSQAVSQEDDDIFEPYSFEEYEYQSAWDGISVDLCFNGFDGNDGDDLSEECQKIQDGYDEDSTMFLEEEGFDIDDSEVFMYGELDVEEV
jgi:hypothetical protein